MRHISIAVIKKLSSNFNETDNKYDYLVIKEQSNLFRFLDQKSNSWGGEFDYTEFKKYVIKYLGLFPKKKNSRNKFEKEDIEEFEKVDFENPPTPFKSSKRNPYATAYEYQLSKKQVNYIEEGIETNEGIWRNISWQSEEELLRNRNKWVNHQKFIFKKEKPFNPPIFTKTLRASLKNIVKAKNNGKLVIFAGAGISFDSNVPGWSKLISELKNDLDDEEKDYLTIGQIYYDSRGKKEYIDKIQEVLKHGHTKYNPIHEKIVELKPLHIITTNYDTHFEGVLNNTSSTYSTVGKDVDLPYSKGASLYIKMHGDFDTKNIVLKKSDYGDGYSESFPLIKNFVEGVFASKLVLFIGFSFTDPNLAEILESVENVLGEDNQPPYLLMIPEDRKNKKEKADYKRRKEEISNKGVTVVEYEDAPFDTYYDQVLSKEDEIRLDSLSTVSQRVYKFLKVVEHFDVFSDTLENLKIEQQLSNSILRFKGLNVIPTKILEKLIPFKLKGNSQFEISTNAYYNPYSPFQLQTLNEELLTFLQEKATDNKLLFSNYHNESLSVNEKEFNKALNVLYNSGIHRIVRKSDTSPLQIELKPSDEKKKCNCYQCRYDRFEFSSILKDINTFSLKLIGRDAHQNLELKDAYAFLKMGQVVKAFYLLDDLVNKSWKNQQYITYFLALYNQKLMRPIISILYDRSIDEQEMDVIKDKIDRIDLNQVIYEVPIDPLIKETLTYIKENKTYERVQSTVNREFQSILKNYRGYKKKDYRSMGPHYWHKVETSFYGLWQFYHTNLLFNDEYDYFINLSHTYLESMIASYHTGQAYNQRLPHFSSFFILVFLTYGNPKKLKRLLTDYNVSSFELNNQKKDLKEVLNSFKSYCESGYEKSLLFNDIFGNQSYRLAYTNSNLFKNKIQGVFNNFLLLLGKLKLSKTQVNSCVEWVVNYLTVNKVFKAHTSLQHFSDFIYHYITFVNKDNTEKIAYYIISDEICSDDLIEPFCDAVINKQKRENFLNEDFYERMIGRTKNKNKWTVSLKSMIPFYCLLDKNSQKSFRQNLLPLLNENDNIRKGYYWGVWTPKEDKNILDKYLADLLIESKNFPDFKIDEEGNPEGIRSFAVWNSLFFYIYLLYTNDLLIEQYTNSLHETINSKMFKWSLKPNKFNYEEFEMNWIILFRDNGFIKILKETTQLKDTISKKLKKNYNEKVAKIYFERLMK